MIDVHCHLEQPDYKKDREAIIEKCREHLHAIITSCAHPKDFDLTLELKDKFNGFVYATAGIHPEYIKTISNKEIESFIKRIKESKNLIVGIGETGLDYYWIKEEYWRERQKKLFLQLISLAKKSSLPIIIHSRDAYEETVEILECENTKSVVMHMFGANQLAKKVVDNGWFFSMNSIVLKSKKHRKVVRDTPINQLLLETDSPWLAPEGFKNKRNDSTSLRFVGERIAEIKKISFDEVDKATTENAVNLFKI